VDQELPNCKFCVNDFWNSAHFVCREGASIPVRCATRITKTAKQPKSPRGLSGALRRILPQLHLIGIAVKFDRIDKAGMIALGSRPATPMGAIAPAPQIALEYERSPD